MRHHAVQIEAGVDGIIAPPKTPQHFERDVAAATLDTIALVRDFEPGLSKGKKAEPLMDGFLGMRRRPVAGRWRGYGLRPIAWARTLQAVERCNA
jgi:hypothetical protein